MQTLHTAFVLCCDFFGIPYEIIKNRKGSSPCGFAIFTLMDYFFIFLHSINAAAAGAFVQGSSIELSADGPIREPYAVYFQGGLTWAHAKLGILMSLQKLVEKGLVQLP